MSQASPQLEGKYIVSDEFEIKVYGRQIDSLQTKQSKTPLRFLDKPEAQPKMVQDQIATRTENRFQDAAEADTHMMPKPVQNVADLTSPKTMKLDET